MVEASSVQWVDHHGFELIGVAVESAIETLRGVGFKVMVSEFPRPDDLTLPSGTRVAVYVDQARRPTRLEAA